jgi:hypothetical protein
MTKRIDWSRARPRREEPRPYGGEALDPEMFNVWAGRPKKTDLRARAEAAVAAFGTPRRCYDVTCARCSHAGTVALSPERAARAKLRCSRCRAPARIDACPLT